MEALKLNQFYDYKFLSNVRWSPDGKQAAFCVAEADPEDNSYKANLWLFRDGQSRRLTGMDKEKGFFWEDDTHILFPAVRSDADKKRAEAGDIFTAFYRIATDGGEAVKAFELPIAVGELQPTGDGRWFFITAIDHKYPDVHLMSKEEKGKMAEEIKENSDYIELEEWPFWHNGGTHVERERHALFLYDPAAEEGRQITRVTEPLFTVGDAVWADGRLWFLGMEIVKYGTLPRFGFYCYNPENGDTRCITEPGEWLINGLVKLSEEKLIVLKTLGEHFSYEQASDYYFFDVKTGTETLAQGDPLEMGNSTGSDCRLGGGYQARVSGGECYYICTDRNAAILKKIDVSGKCAAITRNEGSVDAFDINKNGEILAICMLENRLQELYSVKDGVFTKLTSFNDDVLADKYVADYEKIQVPSRGYTIDGWILKPINYDPNKTYPAILDIHGGPRTVYGQVFYHEMQYWAGQGYFVFFCNPYGSDGRGDSFADMRGKYGTTDFWNIMDFTDEVIHRYPQIDEKRVAVTGGSYGGFMTNWIIGHTDRFCCAATQRSISNWISFYGVSDIGTFFAEHHQDADIFFSADDMWLHSPLAYAQNFKTPTLIIHSDADYRCPISEGYQLYTALKEKGVDSRMVVFKGENHELSRSGKPKHRVRRLTEISDWFDKYCK